MNILINRIATSFGLFLAAALPAFAQLDTGKLGKLDMVSVDRFKVITTDDSYILRMEVTFQNMNAESIKLRNANFALSVEPGKGSATSKLEVGQGRIAELVVPGTEGKSGVRGATAAEFDVKIGPKNEVSSARIIQILNLFANPADTVRLNLKGTSELGLYTSHGPIFVVGKTYEVDLTFEPQLRRGVALN